MTYYWIDPVVCAQLFVTAALLLGGRHAIQLDFRQYALHVFPLMAAAVLLRQLALSIWRHPSVPLVLPWRAAVLVFTTWPIYTLALIMAVLRFPLAFRLTPKTRTGTMNPLWLLPQMVMMVVLGAAVLRPLLVGDGVNSPLLVVTALSEVILHMVLILQWYRGRAGETGAEIRVPA